MRRVIAICHANCWQPQKGPTELTATDKLAGRSPSPRIFVFLGHGFGAGWARGELPGINDAMPYGYHHVNDEGCIVAYSQDGAEGRILCLMRMGLRRSLGFDLIHAWRNCRGLRNADVVWTHTELESLAALALMRLSPAASRPRIIAQSVWLFGRWTEFSRLTCWLYRRLLSGADLLTVQCGANRDAAERLLPGARLSVVPYGIDLQKIVPACTRMAHSPLRILSLGRDMHRDWETLVAATSGRAEFEVRIGARKISRKLLMHSDNLTLVRPTSAQLADLYQWADLVVLPLKPNLHVSGITVVSEAALFGVPVVCTRAGGLEEYFDDQCVSYVPAGDHLAMRRAITELAADDRRRFAMARNAQSRLVQNDFSTRAHAKRLPALSRELLSPAIAETGRPTSGQATSA
jgi:glycosyltransferase involved in cell wall biosynthesis